jgi:nucleoside-diphosphate-sugar epimerase
VKEISSADLKSEVKKRGIKMGRCPTKMDFAKKLPEDDPKVRQPDISIAREVLHWEPRVSRTEGLKRTQEYFKRKLGI